MRTKTPLQAKTPFAIDNKPMEGLLTSRAGLSAVSRAFRSLGVPAACDAYLQIKQRSSGFTPGQKLESLVMLHLAGGDCMQDIDLLRTDGGVTKMLGYTVPSQRCIADFIEAFHDAGKIEQARAEAQRQELLSFIPEQTTALLGLARVQQSLVHALAARQPTPVSTATVDMDATIIESQKRQAQRTYEGTRGYQPMVAVWAETELILADEFRDGNVPAISAPLQCAQAAFATLPNTIIKFFFRGDSACHESELLAWLRNPDRADGPKGIIEFCISARMSDALRAKVTAIHETRWTTYETEPDGTARQWTEVAFVPGEKGEKKGIVPLRYVGLRLLKPQGTLFNDGSDRRHFAVLTNRMDINGGDLLKWHREKAGTIEHVHDEVKNGLGGGQLPSGKFGANAAWFRIACIAYNILVALRTSWSDETLHHAKAKRVRFVLFNMTGRFSRDRRKITLHIAAPDDWIKRFIDLFDAFPLLTQPTG